MPGAQRRPNKWIFDSPYDGYLSEMVQNNNGHVRQSYIYTAHLYASLIQIISFTFMFMHNYFENKKKML